MKRIQVPNPNEKSFTVPIFTLSGVLIQKWHYIAMHPKPENLCFIVYQLQISLYFMCIPLPCNCLYLEKNVYFFFYLWECLTDCIKFKCTFKNGIKSYFTFSGLLLFLNCEYLSTLCSTFHTCNNFEVCIAVTLKEKLILDLEILVQITTCLMVFGQRIPTVFTNTQLATLCKIFM